MPPALDWAGGAIPIPEGLFQATLGGLDWVQVGGWGSQGVARSRDQTLGVGAFTASERTASTFTAVPFRTEVRARALLARDVFDILNLALTGLPVFVFL